MQLTAMKVLFCFFQVLLHIRWKWVYQNTLRWSQKMRVTNIFRTSLIFFKLNLAAGPWRSHRPVVIITLFFSHSIPSLPTLPLTDIHFKWLGLDWRGCKQALLNYSPVQRKKYSLLSDYLPKKGARRHCPTSKFTRLSFVWDLRKDSNHRRKMTLC